MSAENNEAERKLKFVTWNIRGIKGTGNTGNPGQKRSDVLDELKNVGAKIAFIQETHVGPKCCNLSDEIKDWKVYFTVYSPRSKGVAILIRDDNDETFEYICHDEDHSGGYIVLFCRLYGELFTVNVYNHRKDRSVLYRLRDYLQETAEGVLVVGGDFNTVLDPYFDRRSTAGHTESSSLRGILEYFTASLNLRDTWAHLHPTEMGYTRSETRKKRSKGSKGNEQSERNKESEESQESEQSFSRIDMFFMPENIIGIRVSNCEIHRQRAKKISDHDPVVLTLSIQQQSVSKTPAVASKLKVKTDRRPEKISGAEILSAIKSLTDSGEQRPDNMTVDYYKQPGCPLTKTLKIQYNSMLKDRCITSTFKEYRPSGNNCIFNVDYLIFSQILATRLKVFITPSFRSQKKAKMDCCLKITLASSPNKIKRYFLHRILQQLKPVRPSVPRDFSILDSLLPDDRSCPGEFRLLLKGCPLTKPILNLALKHLKDQIIKTDSLVSFCHFRHALFIQTEMKRFTAVDTLIKQFELKSGIIVK